MTAVCVLLGGPTLYMPNVRGRAWPFEMHPHMGPCPLTPKTEEPMAVKSEPAEFWRRWEKWDLGGRVLEGNQCVVPEWCKACGGGGSKTEHLGGRQYLDLGPCDECSGKRVVLKGTP